MATSGRSLAMNSAPSDATKSTPKITSDHAPRRLRRKLSSRRRFIGERAKRRVMQALANPPQTRHCEERSDEAILGPRGARRSPGLLRFARNDAFSPSHLARFEVDARIDPGVGEVGDQVHH